MPESDNPVDELARLMDEFSLEEAELSRDGVKVKFARRRKPVVQSDPVVSTSEEPAVEWDDTTEHQEAVAPAVSTPNGVPIPSPMTGIFYLSAGPDSPPYVNVGDHFESGDIIGLIEAMKVFNEVAATAAGTVIKIAAEAGSVLQAGDPILYYEPA